MNSIAQQTGLLSVLPLHGHYRYRDLFQILPVAVVAQNPPLPLSVHRPLILEICYCPDIWPHREQNLWYRDLWEQQRFESIKNHSGMKEWDSSDEWVRTYESITKLMRWGAIIDEVSCLLTLFTNHHFFTYGSEQYWFIPVGPGMGHADPQWGQLLYKFDALKRGVRLSDPEGAEAERIPVTKYYTCTRDAFNAGEDNFIRLPEIIDQLFDGYFGLDSNSKTAYYTACRLYNQALVLRHGSASLSLVATVMAIEALVNSLHGDGLTNVCDECSAPESIEKCAACGLPRHRATSRFKQFLADFWDDSREAMKFADALYRTRSKLAHGGLLRDDLHDSGFSAGDRDEEQMFRRISLVFTRIAMINWLIRS